MIKKSLKNFGKNLIYVFVPMGIVYLFLLIAVFSLIGTVAGAAGDAVTATVDELKVALEESDTSVTEFLSYSFGKINWKDNPFTIIKTILDTKWLSTTIKGFFETLNVSVEGFGDNINAIVATFKKELVAGITVAAVLAVIGLTAANYATRYVMRNRVAKRNFKQFVIAHTFVPLFQTIMGLLSIVLLATIRLYSLLVFVAIVLLMGTVSICTSYLIYRDNTISLKQLLTGKMLLQYAAVLGIIFLLNIAICGILWLISPLLAILIVLPLTIYSANIVEVNTDSYVAETVAKNAVQQQESLPAEQQS